VEDSASKSVLIQAVLPHASWLDRCAMRRRSWLQGELGAGGARAKKLIAERELDGGIGRRERRGRRPVGRGISEGEVSGRLAPAWGLGTEAVVCLHA
jgi:hypothetical protein